MADLYRKSSLERISSPEQLDKALKVTSPMSWLALIAITVVIAVTIVWACLGTIPETITAHGIILDKNVGSNAVYTKEFGKVIALLVKQGDEIRIGQPVMYFLNSEHQQDTLYSDQDGFVSQLIAKKDDELNPGAVVVRVRPRISQSKQIVVCFVSLTDSGKLERGMEVNVEVDSLESRSYGHMVARIVNIDTISSSDGLTYVIGSNTNLIGQLTANNASGEAADVAVACELYPSREGEETTSGYYWSTPRGARATVENNKPVTVKIVSDNLRPIEKLFTKLRDFWGD